MTADIFTKSTLNCIIQLNPGEYNNSIDDILLEKLKSKVEGKCDSFGYIKPDSAQIIKRSIGMLAQSDFRGLAEYRIVYSVDVCNPVEGMIVKCIVRNINKMGLFCELAEESPSPLSLILAKQHHLKNDKFELVKINDIISVEVVGIKFNYNDTNISCIGKLSSHDLTMEQEMENTDNIEIELTGSEDDDTDEEITEEEVTDDEEVTDEVTESAVTEAEGLNLDIVTEKALQEEETDVLENLSKAEISSNNLEEPLEVADMVDMEGVQDLESVDLISKSGEGELKTEVEEPNSDLDELGEEFEGEKLDLEDMSRQNLTPIFNKEELENPDKKPDKSIFELNVLSHPKYKTFPKPRKNSTMYVNYLIYVQLNNMMIDFYNKNGVEVKKICLNNKHSYLAQIKQYLDKVGKSLKVEEVEGLSYVI